MTRPCPYRRPYRPALVLACLTLTLASCTPDAGRQARLDAAFLRIVAAEDARPADGPELAVLIEATHNDRQLLRRSAVRALGRLENPAVAEHVVPLLGDPSARVRATAANALAQAYQTSDGQPALAPLAARVDAEEHPAVRGVLARSLGRLSLPASGSTDAQELILELSRGADGVDAPASTLLGVALGLEATTRRTRGLGLAPRAARRLEGLLDYRGSPDGSANQVRDASRVRSLAYLSLGQAGRIGEEHIRTALADPAGEVGAVAVRFVGSVPAAARSDLARRAVEHESLHVVVEGLRYLTSRPRDAATCSLLLRAAVGGSPGASTAARVIAIDALADPCPDLGAQRRVVEGAVAELDEAGHVWQPSAHALVTLAGTSPDAATAVLSDFVAHANAFVRTYAARAAAILGNTGVLNALVDDPVANVRTAAVSGLAGITGRAADPVLIRQLQLDDSQLLMTTARLLEGTAATEAGPALLDAFERISADGRETRRDARRALLGRLAEVGDVAMSPRLEPYLTDYDVAVAEDVASILQDWNGRPHVALPSPPLPAPLPGTVDLRAMDGGSIVLHMEGGGRIEIALLPFESATNTFRFFRLARSGHFDGLTFHRWAPNFVIQGGSPGANEYEGDAAFSRDEVDLRGHWRGTVGISTRGHDTGDGQIFVNLLDNVRLDHVYTIVGTVVSGMDVVDDVLEGAVIERAEVLEAGPRE